MNQIEDSGPSVKESVANPSVPRQSPGRSPRMIAPRVELVGHENVPPSMNITTPAVPVPLGTPFPVVILADEGVVWRYDPVERAWDDFPAVTFDGGFTLSFDTGEVFTTPTVSNNPLSVTLKRLGVHKATAKAAATGADGHVVVSSGPATFIVGIPAVSLAQPQPGAVVGVHAGGNTTPVAVTTNKADWFGGLTVTARVADPQTGNQIGQQAVTLTSVPSADPNKSSWRGDLPLDPNPLGTRQIVVTVVASVAPQLVGRAVVNVSTVDIDPPILTVAHPPNGGKVVVDSSLSVRLEGAARDIQSGVSTGPARVEVALSSGGPWVATVPGQAADFSQWSATVTASSLGPFTVYLRATDAATNTTPVLAWQVEAISSYTPATLDERLSETEYLAALMAFARDQVNGPSGQVSAADLIAALQQPLDRMAEPLGAAAAASQAPVNELRVPVEFLRRRMADSGISGAPGQDNEARYLQVAYETLLSAAGTSFAEMRLARGADPASRTALADRLGIALYGPPGSSTGRPDQLDALTLDGPALSEQELERLFGLQQTAAGLDPLRPVPTSQLLAWQLASQASQWQIEDLTPPTTRAYRVVVDPDVITAQDIAAGSPLSGRIQQLLQDRAGALANQTTKLKAALASATDAPAKLAAILGAGLPGVTPTTLTDWKKQETEGTDIGSLLAAVGLDRAGYQWLLHIRSLAGVADPTEAEWHEVMQVLLGAFRRARYADWLAEENGISLSPGTFVDSGQGPSLSALRIGPRARTDWNAVLAARTARRQGLTDSAAAIVVAAEQAALPILRDALLADVAATIDGDVGEFLTGVYQIDFRSSGTVTTSRMAQATASLQTLLELVRSGDVSPNSTAHAWRLRSDSTAFDVAWNWMGGLASWRQATTAFLFPEASLDPALVDKPSGDYQALVEGLQQLPGDASPADVLTLVNTYCTARTVWLAGAGVPSPAPLGYLSSRNRGHQDQLAGWSAFLEGPASNNASAAREIFWAAPLLAGRRLLAAGHYQEALDWLWVAFPYNDPGAKSSYSRINSEVQNAPSPPDLTFPPNWTADLNPFHHVSGRVAPYLRYTLLTIVSGLISYGDSEFSTDSDAAYGHARTLYLTAEALLSHPRFQAIAPSSPGEATLTLPQVEILTRRVHAQLTKLRQGRNIAGLPRVVTGLGDVSNAIRQPTPYHFRVLLARAQQLTQQAGQFEAEYLSLLEKYDNGTLKLSDAWFAAGLADLQVKVHDARVQEAADSTKSSEVQKAKADAMSATYSDALNAPPNQYESALLDQYGQLRDLQGVVSVATGAIGVAQAAAGGMDMLKELFSFGAAGVSAGVQIAGYGVKAGAEIAINGLQSQMQANQLMSGIEERRRQLAVQQAGAAQDVLVAAAQMTIARDQLAIAQDEREVAEKQNEQAKTTLSLLTSQFTNPDLYLWMSDTLGSVYRYFLQQATATARLAEAQLAFERVEPAKGFIASDYWKAPQGSSKSGAPAKDTKGMTGAEVLAQDLTRLDQYAFTTDTRRLNVSQTFSLAQLLPTDFLAFRRTGQLTFTTPMAWFDQDFPGHYQRLIKQVHLSLVALVPSSRGIRATLTSTGISRVVTPGDFGSFTEVTLRRDPSVISVTSPLNATGVFPLDLQPEIVFPFEGSGVNTQWNFSLPQAANPFDFVSIADLQLTIEYTAMSDPDYESQVVRQLNSNLTRASDRVFSLARDFPDQWYALSNPLPTTNGRGATLELGAADFPAALTDLLTSQVAVRLISSRAAKLPPVPVSVTRTLPGADIGGVATTDENGIASTRRSAPAWGELLESSPVGRWRLAFDESADPLFAGELADVLFVASWHAQSPAWPT